MAVRSIGKRGSGALLPSLPYAHVNLRHNPFGELDLSRRAELAVADVERFVEWLRQPRRAVQLLGEPGRGKTTHLLAIGKHFPHAAYVRIEEGWWPAVPMGCPLLIDEVDALPRWRRWSIFRRPVSIALAGLRDRSGELRRAGLDVLSVRIGDQLQPECLCAMLNRRIEAALRDPGPAPRVTLETAQALIARFGSDIRAIEGHLYDVFQRLPEIGDV